MGIQDPAYDAELLSRLASAYKLDISDWLNQLDDAWSKQDFQAIAKVSRAMSGAAAILSAREVCNVSVRLEMAAQDGVTTLIPDIIQDLRDENARLIEKLPQRTP